MITIEKIYREGFLDGMRYSGKLLEDVSDEDLTISAPCEVEIHKDFMKRSYYKEEESKSTKQHRFVKRLVLDYQELSEEYEKLKEYLTVNNSKKRRDC